MAEDLKELGGSDDPAKEVDEIEVIDAYAIWHDIPGEQWLVGPFSSREDAEEHKPACGHPVEIVELFLMEERILDVATTIVLRRTLEEIVGEEEQREVRHTHGSKPRD